MNVRAHNKHNHLAMHYSHSMLHSSSSYCTLLPSWFAYMGVAAKDKKKLVNNEWLLTDYTLGNAILISLICAENLFR